MQNHERQIGTFSNSLHRQGKRATPSIPILTYVLSGPRPTPYATPSRRKQPTAPGPDLGFLVNRGGKTWVFGVEREGSGGEPLWDFVQETTPLPPVLPSPQANTHQTDRCFPRRLRPTASAARLAPSTIGLFILLTSAPHSALKRILQQKEAGQKASPPFLIIVRGRAMGSST